MFKKITSVALAIVLVAAMFCVGVIVASAEETVHVGDTVKYIFSAGALNDVGGLTVYSTYDAGKLTYVTSEYVYADGMGAVNDTVAGVVHWNDTFVEGINTNNTDIFAVTFTATAECGVSELGLTSNCTELFDTSCADFPGDFNSLVTARVEVIHNDTSEQETTTEGPDDTTTEIDDTTTDISSETSSATSSITSSNTSSTSSAKPNTPDASKPSSSVSSTSTVTSSTSSNASSSAASSSKPASSSNNSSKNTSSNVPAVKTAGTVAIISLVVVLMAAAAVVFFSKKNSANN